MSPGDAPSERAAFADEMLLTDEFAQVPWTHPRRERLTLGRGMEESFGSGAGRSPWGWHGTMVARAMGATA